MTTLPAHLQAILERGRATARPAGDEVDLEPDRLTVEDVARRRRAARRRLYDESVPARFTDATLADLAPAAEWTPKIAGWLSSDSPTLLLYGGVGVGKTHAGYAVLRAAADAGRYVAGFRLGDLLDALRPDAAPSRLPRVAQDSDVLLIDDLGAERATEWAVEQFESLVDHRSREARRLIVTTNLDGATLRQRYGDRALSRLRGGATAVQLAGADRRRDLW
ncbi:ATP-binding protein [Aeromicrobium sp. Leaf291]|uniref:ATP-binding protein n=1 Tax=Aeromicrobium sp. Leaf291 TaxID=1736325 RepID=UPI0006F9E905|nr:ATP-binding protein [Aeromicrobium sp. Leaf291]KQP81553.1 hypothetical protein ASF35_16105 [Aeromicrobium sp. Leaf291]